MAVVYKFLFPSKPEGNAFSLFLLALRILFGVLLLSHGVQKWMNFSAMSGSFPDPLGVGSTLSLGLAIFGEVFCSVGFIFGAFYRLALIPMIFTMGMAFFVIHANDPFAIKELAFIYLVVFILMYITGPGKFSIDHIISSALSKKKR
ncbi:DoxX family protein [uncultured Parabacteroides sp.]|jgi:putative oxidoreductase|uniref:DoxX family protein n=1 Tax=Parabacteroides sp. ASD2025 TaxID=3415987 RepID=UPI0025D208AE|nr:DoxX family protein [uncultured Parabacteroides sp.]